MIKITINVLILALFVDQAIQVFGELIVLHKPKDFDTFRNIKDAQCISENDGSALAYIQNSDDENELFILNPNIKGFYSTCDDNDGPLDCKMNKDETCLEQWHRKGWKLTHSMDTPMGPVFDQRWETFPEYGFGIEYNISLSDLSEVVVPFSVRARSDVNILICKNKYKTNLCYWVIIGGWNNTKSVIRKCPTGVLIHQYPQDNSKCTEHVFINHKALSLYEWRTFILTWNSVTRNISLYDSDQLIMSYEDREDYENSNIFHGISFSTSQNHSFIRYHNYTFLYTRNYTSTLLSPTYKITDGIICFQLLIGLCAECEATVVLNDATTKNRIGSIEVSGTSTIHGLPMWQFITIKTILKPIYDIVKLEVIPRYTRRIFWWSNIFNLNLLWAIANIRSCTPEGCLRMTENIHYYKLQPHLIICQKLFYQEQSVVDLLSDAKLYVKFDDESCDLAYVLPKCVFTCGKNLESQEDCRRYKICNKNGCTCPPGLQGPNCDHPCNKGFYGYNCKKQCGSCHRNKPCGLTGICPTGCKNRRNYTYVPPHCQLGISKPNEPEIIFTNQTTIVATAQIKWEEEYKKEKLLYSFYMQLLDGRSVYRQNPKQIFENTTQIGIFEDLEPDTSYKIMYILSIAQLEVTSDWKTVETNCDLPYAPRNFTYSFKNKGVVDLKWLHPWKTCGFDLCCFRIRIQEISSHLTSNTSCLPKYEILEYLQTDNTYNHTKQLYLLPSTLYNISIQTVTIQNKTSNTNSLKISTPSSVGLDGELEIWTQKSNTKIILRIPKVLNDTRDSVTYIVIIEPTTCEQNAKLPKHLLKHVGEKKMKRIWQIIERPTNGLVNDVFMISGNSSNCPLKNGELYKIIIIITESELSGDGVMFMREVSFYFGGPPPTYFELWFICVILVLSGLSAVFYFSRK